MYKKLEYEIPVWKKALLDIVEAAAYSGIGQTKLRQMAHKEDCPFALWIGRRCLIKRKQLDRFLDQMYSI